MEPTYYYQIRINTIPDIVEPLSNFLFECGATGVLEQHDSILGYFSAQADDAELLGAISRYLHDLRDMLNVDLVINITFEVIENRDWNAEWKKSWHSIRVSDSILVKPTWEPTPTPAPPVVIEIDPEMAFGSGEHSTTKLMLQLIERHIHPEQTLLDIGTGTGILSIGALMLGAQSAVGLDIDPIAAHTAKTNALRNHVADRFAVFAGTLDALKDTTFDVIAANVNRSVILKMLPDMCRHLKPHGLCLLSGILHDEERMIREACHAHHLSVLSVQKGKEWLAFETRSKYIA